MVIKGFVLTHCGFKYFSIKLLNLATNLLFGSKMQEKIYPYSIKFELTGSFVAHTLVCVQH